MSEPGFTTQNGNSDNGLDGALFNKVTISHAR